MKYPPLDRLFYVPRAATIANIAEKYLDGKKIKSKKELLQERELIKKNTDPSLQKKLIVEGIFHF